MGFRDEDWVDVALESGEDVGTKILFGLAKTKLREVMHKTHVDRADKILIAHHDVGEHNPKDDGENPCADEALNGLFRADLDELRTPEGDTAQVSEDVICDDECNRQKEPDHAFEDIVHDEVSLNDDQIERHVRPSKLCELELIVALLERNDEEDES